MYIGFLLTLLNRLFPVNFKLNHCEPTSLNKSSLITLKHVSVLFQFTSHDNQSANDFPLGYQPHDRSVRSGAVAEAHLSTRTMSRSSFSVSGPRHCRAVLGYEIDCYLQQLCEARFVKPRMFSQTQTPKATCLGTFKT